MRHENINMTTRKLRRGDIIQWHTSLSLYVVINVDVDADTHKLLGPNNVIYYYGPILKSATTIISRLNNERV